ncbi:MAG: DNA-3-methyladenine glycosylase [Holophagales bacterium]|jgi:DNA-3-methyladenine glycosylase|nr:DNA-3-methyladenine glycosylase [Holophagales bacterium]
MMGCRRTLIPQSFYLRPVEVVAPELLGKLLCRNGVVLRITEVEAYGGSEDSASHCRFGHTERNAPMWGMGGHCYVYLCYGIHQMLNIVAGFEGGGAAVLIRSCEVVEGLEKVLERRRAKPGMTTAILCNGPGKVAQALAIDKSFNNHPLFLPSGLELREGSRPASIERSGRIGIGYASESDKSALLRYITFPVQNPVSQPGMLVTPHSQF